MASMDSLVGAPGKIAGFALFHSGVLEVKLLRASSLHRTCDVAGTSHCATKPIKKPMTSMDYLIGAPGKIRTCDLLYRKQTLYPAELRVLGNETNLRFVSSRRALAKPKSLAALFPSQVVTGTNFNT